MRLTFDLRSLHAARGGETGDRRVTIEDLAAMARRPRELADLLWGRRYDRVTVAVGALPLNGTLAGALGLAGLTRTRDLAVESPAGVRSVRRVPYLASASARLAVLLPREIISSARLARRARRTARHRFDIPAAVRAPRTVAYLRPQPTLNYMGAYVGGAATHTTGVINGFAANGVDVHVYATQLPGGLQAARFTDVALRRLYSFIHWLTLYAYSDELVRAAAAEPVDAVYQRYALGSYAGLELARRRRVPFVLEFNGSEIWASRQWGTGRVPLADTLLALEDRNLRDASLIVVVSSVLKEELVAERGIDPDRILVNPNGVDPEAMAELRAHPAAWWRAHTGRPEAPTVGFIGTFGLWHGVKVLPAMIAALADVRPDARWILVGDGLLHDEVRAELVSRGLDGRVELTGVLAHEHAIEALAACDVCVSPHVPNPDGSRFFGSPTKLFEYMGLAKAIVASDLEQIGEVIEHERTGLLVAPEDAGEAAAAVARLLADDELRVRLGDAALAAAQERYSWAAHVQRICQAMDAGSATAPPQGVAGRTGA